MFNKIVSWFFIFLTFVFLVLFVIALYLVFCVRCLFKWQAPTWSRFEAYFSDTFEDDKYEEPEV